MTARDHDDGIAGLRVPPHSVEAEQHVLGALLLDNLAWDRVADVLSEGDFYRYEHRLIYAAIGCLINATKPADLITVLEQLRLLGKADECGGLAYLNALTQGVLSAANIHAHAEKVREHAMRRRLIATTSDADSIAWGAGDIAADIDRVTTMFAKLDRTLAAEAPTDVSKVVIELLDDIDRLAGGEEPPGLKTGSPTLDLLLEGIIPGLYYFGGRPGVGKSSFASQVALNIARSGHRVLYLSLEMGKKQVTRRMLANLVRVDYSRLKSGRLNDEEWERLSEGADELGRLAIDVDDEGALRLSDIRRKVRAAKGLGCLVIDYLQLCGSDLRTDNRNAQIEEISRGLKALSKDFNVPVIALSQLNRKVEDRADKRPSVADLRDSGSIEQDADAIVLLWPVRRLADGQQLRGCEVAKNRDGPCGEFGLAFDGAQQRWVESTEDIRPPMRGPRPEL